MCTLAATQLIPCADPPESFRQCSLSFIKPKYSTAFNAILSQLSNSSSQESTSSALPLFDKYITLIVQSSGVEPYALG